MLLLYESGRSYVEVSEFPTSLLVIYSIVQARRPFKSAALTDEELWK